MKQLRLDQLTFHPMSNAEPECRLFSFEGRLYRGASGVKGHFLRGLWQQGVIQGLVEKGLFIETSLADLAVDGFDVVFEHRLLRFPSFPFEWCAEMLRAAAAHILQLSLELDQHSLVLTDPHSWNVLFDGPRPLYIDLGSLTPTGEDPWPGHADFLRFSYYPLLLMSRGQAHLARWLLNDGYAGVLESEVRAVRRVRLARWERSSRPAGRFSRLVKLLAPTALHQTLKGARQAARSAGRVMRPSAARRRGLLDRLGHRVAAMRFPEAESSWRDYADTMPALDNRDSWTSKQTSAAEILAATRPRTVAEAGCNRGWYARLAAKRGSHVVAFDLDEPSVGRLFGDVSRDGLSVLPLIMNVMAPTPCRGVGRLQAPDAPTRMRAELVFALALVHHLALAQNRTWDHIAEALSAFTESWLAVEWVPSEDEQLRLWPSAERPSYRLDCLEAALAERGLMPVRTLPSHPEPRVLVLFQRRSRP